MSQVRSTMFTRRFSKNHQWPGNTVTGAIRKTSEHFSIRLGDIKLTPFASSKRSIASAVRLYNKNNNEHLSFNDVSRIIRNLGTKLGINEASFYGLENIDVARLTIDSRKLNRYFDHVFVKMTRLKNKYYIESRYFKERITEAKTAEEKGFFLLTQSYATARHDLKTWIHENEVGIIGDLVMRELGIKYTYLENTRIPVEGVAFRKHDTGKNGILAALLHNKKLKRMKDRHVRVGENIAKWIKWLPQIIAKTILFHHFDQGYPDEVIGKKPPKLAQILNVVDVFHAMMTRGHHSIEEIFAVLTDPKNNFYQPAVKALMKIVVSPVLSKMFPGSIIYHPEPRNPRALKKGFFRHIVSIK
jgi:HD-GYP domain-containing protein (c-di-GMP phosphodiesterase class II)